MNNHGKILQNAVEDLLAFVNRMSSAPLLEDEIRKLRQRPSPSTKLGDTYYVLQAFYNVVIDLKENSPVDAVETGGQRVQNGGDLHKRVRQVETELSEYQHSVDNVLAVIEKHKRDLEHLFDNKVPVANQFYSSGGKKTANEISDKLEHINTFINVTAEEAMNWSKFPISVDDEYRVHFYDIDHEGLGTGNNPAEVLLGSIQNMFKAIKQHIDDVEGQVADWSTASKNILKDFSELFPNDIINDSRNHRNSRFAEPAFETFQARITGSLSKLKEKITGYENESQEFSVLTEEMQSLRIQYGEVTNDPDSEVTQETGSGSTAQTAEASVSQKARQELGILRKILQQQSNLLSEQKNTIDNLEDQYKVQEQKNTVLEQEKREIIKQKGLDQIYGGVDVKPSKATFTTTSKQRAVANKFIQGVCSGLKEYDQHLNSAISAFSMELLAKEVNGSGKSLKGLIVELQELLKKVTVALASFQSAWDDKLAFSWDAPQEFMGQYVKEMSRLSDYETGFENVIASFIFFNFVKNHISKLYAFNEMLIHALPKEYSHLLTGSDAESDVLDNLQRTKDSISESLKRLYIQPVDLSLYQDFTDFKQMGITIAHRELDFPEYTEAAANSVMRYENWVFNNQLRGALFSNQLNIVIKR